MDVDPVDLRISDTEREDAMRMLGEHMSVGRLGIDEYGERSAKVTAAKTRGEVLALFTDLPDPRPVFGAATSAAPMAKVPAAAPPTAPTGWDKVPVGQRVMGALVPVSALVALALFFTVAHVWMVFLIPAAVAIIGGAIWGDQHRDFQRRMRDDRRDLHRQMRDRRRQLRRGWGD